MAQQRKARILVAEAESVARFGLAELLASHKQLMLCGEAETLRGARDLATRLKPEVLVFDPVMGDAFAFLKELREWTPVTRTVALSNRCDTLSVQRAMKAGVCGYVSRRDPLAALMNAILGAVVNERHIGPQVQEQLLSGLAIGTMEMRGSEESRLSDRELQVYQLIGQGLKTRAVAAELKVSIKTVESHRQRIREKLQLADGSELQRRAVLYHGSINGGDRFRGEGLEGMIGL